MQLQDNLLERTSDLTKQRILRGSIQNTPENGDFTGSSTVCDRNQQKNIKNRKTELKKTGIAPIVLWHQNGRG